MSAGAMQNGRATEPTRIRCLLRKPAADYRKRLRDKQVERLMRVDGLSREYAKRVVELVYRRAG